MKYLLFSDIHGCLPALEKVLDFFEAEHCDMMCIMGDIINYGPRNRNAAQNLMLLARK